MNQGVQLFINNRKIEVPQGATILEAALGLGIEIPTFCYRKELSPAALCRICVVEVEGVKNLVASCHTPVTKGAKVLTDSSKVLQARKVILEMMMANHPDNCLVCDKGNTCELRRLAALYEVGVPPFKGRKHFFSVEDANPYIIRDLTKCILCRRCVRICKEIKGDSLFAIGYRGFASKVVVENDKELYSSRCEECDKCVYVCPVGALIKRTERFKKKLGGELMLIKGEIL